MIDQLYASFNATSGSIRVAGSTNPTVQLDARRIVYADSRSNNPRLHDGPFSQDVNGETEGVETVVVMPVTSRCETEG